MLKVKMCSNLFNQNRKHLFSILLLSLTFFLLTVTTLHTYRQRLVVNQSCLQNQPLTMQYSTSAHEHPKWFSHIYQHYFKCRKKMRIALINLNSDQNYSQQPHGLADLLTVKFDRVSHALEWEQLFPDPMIDMIDPSVTPPNPKCPDIPMPAWEDYQGLDVVVAKVPCGYDSRWRKDGIRDLFGLQINLIVANLAVASKSGDGGAEGEEEEAGVYVVFVGECEPMQEIFRCDDMLRHESGKYRLYSPDIRKLKEKVLMPVGSCELASRPNLHSGKGQTAIIDSVDHHLREAYVTMLHSSERYVCGAIALAQSLLRTNTTKDLVLLADPSISGNSIQGLKAAGWKVRLIERIRSPFATPGVYNEWNYSILWVWQLIEYDKVIYIDTDFIVLQNIDHLFSYPQLSAGPDIVSKIFNGGFLVIEPSECLFNHLMSKQYTLRSYNDGNQGYLNEVFTWWHRLAKELNYLKYYPCKDGKCRTRAMPNDLYAIHFVGVKPWLCYRDYDCNWDTVGSQIFANDRAHERWWGVYDEMPVGLKGYCGLSKEMDETLRRWRDEASKKNLTDGHWRIVVEDPRRNIQSLMYL